MGKFTKGFGPRGDHDQAELNGTQASAVYQPHNPHQILFSNRGESYEFRPVPAEFLKRSDSTWEPNEGDPLIRFRYDQAWEFISAIREGRECTPYFYHGIRAQAVADAILEAAESRKWVDVKF